MNLWHLPSKRADRRKQLFSRVNIHKFVCLCLFLVDTFLIVHIIRTTGIPIQIQSLLYLGKYYLVFIIGANTVCLYWKVIRPYFWRHSDAWWVLAWELFKRGVVVLTLWISISLLVFIVLYYFMLRLPNPDKSASLSLEKAIAILIALLTGLIGFATNQYKILDEEFKSRKDEERELLQRIESARELLERGKYSEATAEFLETKKKSKKISHLNYQIDELWSTYAPEELQCVVKMFQATDYSSACDAQDRHKIKRALEWAIDELDERWRPNILSIINSESVDSGISYVDLIWPAIFKAYTQDFKEIPDLLSIDEISLIGLGMLGWKENPFPAVNAEFDPWVISGRMAAYIQPSWWQDVVCDMIGHHETEGGNWSIFYFPARGGKTAACLQIALKVLKDTSSPLDEKKKSKHFPVYWRIERDYTLVNLACIIARALAYYIAFHPTSFTRLSFPQQKSISRLFLFCSQGSLLEYMRDAGLEMKGDGEIVLKRMEELTKDLQREKITQQDLHFLLPEVRPAGFDRLLVLADVQGNRSLEDIGELLALGQKLANLRIEFWGFVTVKPEFPKFAPNTLLWSKEDLKQLMRRRLIITGMASPDPLGQLINGMFVEDNNEDRDFILNKIIEAAEGSPGKLIEIVRMLIRCLGQKNFHLSSGKTHPLTLEDLIYILKHSECPKTEG